MTCFCGVEFFPPGLYRNIEICYYSIHISPYSSGMPDRNIALHHDAAKLRVETSLMAELKMGTENVGLILFQRGFSQ